MNENKIFWGKVPSKILKSELSKRNLNYKELLEKFDSNLGIKMTYTDLKTRINRGSFTSMFFLQCLKAMEVKTLFLDEVFFEEKK